MIRSEIAGRIAAAINDPDQVFMTPDELALSIDEAAECLAEDAGVIRRTVFLALRPGATYYHLHGVGEDLITPVRIWDQTRQQRLVSSSLGELDERMRNWPTSTGDPVAWFPLSWDVFGIWPRAGEGGGVLRLDCLAWPRLLMDDDDEPEIPVGDQDSLVTYGAYEGLVKRLDSDKALAAWAEFSGRRQDAVGKVGVKQQARSWQSGRAGDVGLPNGLGRL